MTASPVMNSIERSSAGTTGGPSQPLTSGCLSEPSLDVHASFLNALPEYHREGLHLELMPENLTDPIAFQEWLEGERRAEILGEGDCERDRVPHRILWWVQADEYLGRVRINLQLNNELLDFGGHIGYDIRPSARKKGHATALLHDALLVARDLGIANALLTCAPDNVASRRVIELNGGILVDVSPAGRLRYWCHTG